MKLSDTNIIKTINNFNEIKTKAIALIAEMGFKNIPSEDNLNLTVEGDLLIVRDPFYGSIFRLPIYYFLDEEGRHADEYKVEQDKKNQLEIERIKQYIK